MKKKVIALMVICSMIAGCAEMVPEPPGEEKENTVTTTGWNVMSGNYTVLVGDNNSTTPTIVLGNSSTWLEINKITLNATHLSFEVIDNAIVFSNYSFTIDGYANQSGYLFSSGYAPDIGNATIYTPSFPYDITVAYYCEYKEWVGNE